MRRVFPKEAIIKGEPVLPAITLAMEKKGFMSGKTPIHLAAIGRLADMGIDDHLELSTHTVTSTACLCLK